MMAIEENSRNWLNGSEGQKEGRRVEADLKVERKPKSYRDREKRQPDTLIVPELVQTVENSTEYSGTQYFV